MEEEKPYWLFLDAQDKLTWELFNYFPAAHYKKAIDHAFQEEAEKQVRTDGGRYTDTHYAWFDFETGSYLYHTEVNNEFADPFFDTKGTGTQLPRETRRHQRQTTVRQPGAAQATVEKSR